MVNNTICCVIQKARVKFVTLAEVVLSGWARRPDHATSIVAHPSGTVNGGKLRGRKERKNQGQSKRCTGRVFGDWM